MLIPLTALEPRVRGVLFFILQWSAALGKLNLSSILNGTLIEFSEKS
jgi:hypothetical protein